jgi:hypothetical protein
MSSIFIKEVTDYYQGLSGLHLDVKDSPTNRAFCRFQDNEQFGQLRNAAAKNVVVIMSFFGRAAGDYDDADVKNTVIIRFSSYAKSISSSEITIALEKAFQIMIDFWTRMRHDYEADDCRWLKHVDWSNIQFDQIDGPWLQNHYCWDLVIPYETSLPPFDENRWTDLGAQYVLGVQENSNEAISGLDNEQLVQII